MATKRLFSQESSERSLRWICKIGYRATKTSGEPLPKKSSAGDIKQTQDEEDGKADDSEEERAKFDDVEECVGWAEKEATKGLGYGDGGGHDEAAGKDK